MAHHIKARPTIYKGIQMRSRLEAAYAQFLDSAGINDWEYEPECFADETGQYLPDFRRLTVYVEVKPPNADFDAALSRMHIIRSTHPNARLTVVSRNGQHDHFDVVASCDASELCDECRPITLSRDVIGKLDWCPQYGGHDVIVCPSCGEPTLHARSAQLADAAGTINDPGAVVEMWCECCPTITTLSILSHKGLGYIEVSTHNEDRGE